MLLMKPKLKHVSNKQNFLLKRDKTTTIHIRIEFKTYIRTFVVLDTPALFENNITVSEE